MRRAADHMNYEIDRLRLPDDKAEPSLQEMTAIALRTLDAAAKAKGGNKGFVLLVEGSRIGQFELVKDLLD